MNKLVVDWRDQNLGLTAKLEELEVVVDILRV